MSEKPNDENAVDPHSRRNTKKLADYIVEWIDALNNLHNVLTTVSIVAFLAALSVLDCFLMFIAIKWAIVHWQYSLIGLASIAVVVASAIWEWDGKYLVRVATKITTSTVRHAPHRAPPLY
jgi:hypothetical protein